MEVALIVAGGSGQRMQSSTPKQFLELASKPILMHTIQAFHNYSTDLKILLVLPSDHTNKWQELVIKHNFTIPHLICLGGDTRSQSVENGLSKVDENDIVAIHDGVRPLVNQHIISESFVIAKKTGCAAPVIDVSESLRKITSSNPVTSKAIDRSHYRLVQTPQTFQGHIIKRAYRELKDEQQNYYDDASVVEAQGYSVTLHEGSKTNIKITTGEDLEIAETLLRFKENRV